MSPQKKSLTVWYQGTCLAKGWGPSENDIGPKFSPQFCQCSVSSMTTCTILLKGYNITLRESVDGWEYFPVQQITNNMLIYCSINKERTDQMTSWHPAVHSKMWWALLPGCSYWWFSRGDISCVMRIYLTVQLKVCFVGKQDFQTSTSTHPANTIPKKLPLVKWKPK